MSKVNDPLHLLLINITLDMLGAIIFLKRIHYLTNYHNFMGISHNFTSSLLSYENYQIVKRKFVTIIRICIPESLNTRFLTIK